MNLQSVDLPIHLKRLISAFSVRNAVRHYNGCQPVSLNDKFRPPMFQFAFVSPLLPFKYDKPPFVSPLFRLPKASQLFLSAESVMANYTANPIISIIGLVFSANIKNNGQGEYPLFSLRCALFEFTPIDIR